MKINPPIYRSTGSDAEKKLFKVIEDVDFGDNSICFHSMNISEHLYKKWTEIDFIIISTRGIICLEVKGGRVACDNDGFWSYTDRFNKTRRRSKGPIEQVMLATFGLRDTLKEKNNIDIIDKYLVGWGVVFPDISWNTESPEMPKEIICDKSFGSDSKSFDKYLKRVYGYWEKKNTNKDRISSDGIRKLKNMLRPCFDHAQSLSDISNTTYREIIKFTEEQYAYLDQIEENDRIVCSGGAGTGKSFLAIQTALREASQNKSVLITSLHPIFVKYLENQFSENDFLNITVLPFTECCKNYFLQKFDLVVVDEAQDIMNFDDIGRLEDLINGGLEKGRWRFFMDENAQAGIIGKFEKDVYDLVKSYSFSYKLFHNCRNTTQIVFQTERTTGAHIGETKIKGKGPKVEYKKIKNNEEEAAEITKYIDNLISQDIPLNDIAILSPGSYEKSNIRNIDSTWKRFIENINSDNICSSKKNSILFSCIKDFKGLERKYILIIDTCLFPEDENLLKSLLYVGMSRAQIGLWVAETTNFKKLRHNLQTVHFLREN
jgi:hypothetical protein